MGATGLASANHWAVAVTCARPRGERRTLTPGRKFMSPAAAMSQIVPKLPADLG